MKFSAAVKSPFTIGVIRFLGVTLVIYAFAVVLMTAAAQQQVSSTLASINAGVGYSAAHAKFLGLKQLQDDISELTVEERTHLAEQRKTEFEYQELVSASDAAWGELDSAVQPLFDRGVCAMKASTDRMALWHAARRCLGNEALSTADRAALQGALSRSPSAEELHQRKLAQSRINDRAYNQLLATRASIAEAREKEQQGEKIGTAFEEMRVLTSGWIPGASLLVHFPPTLIQILLAFAAGLFGALLITLVLAVYPKSSVKFAGGEGFGARILLGGLIAVGVYIVLSGGASILGTPAALSAAPSNVMTFCALGILAGMFSDRVAFWLSEKAEIFFARTRTEDVPEEGT